MSMNTKSSRLDWVECECRIHIRHKIDGWLVYAEMIPVGRLLVHKKSICSYSWLHRTGTGNMGPGCMDLVDDEVYIQMRW